MSWLEFRRVQVYRVRVGSGTLLCIRRWTKGASPVDQRLVRRVAPAAYALVILVAVVFAPGALLAVIIVGAVLLGLLYLLFAGRLGGGRRPGRARERLR